MADAITRLDALKQLEQLADCGELSILLDLLTDEQLESLAADFNEGREFLEQFYAQRG